MDQSLARQERQALINPSILWSIWLRTTWLGTVTTHLLTTLNTMFSMTQPSTILSVRSPITKMRLRRRSVGRVMSISSFPIWHSKIPLFRANGQRGSQILSPPTASTAFGLTLALNKTKDFSQVSKQPPTYTSCVKFTTTL